MQPWEGSVTNDAAVTTAWILEELRAPRPFELTGGRSRQQSDVTFMVTDNIQRTKHGETLTPCKRKRGQQMKEKNN